MWIFKKRLYFGRLGGERKIQPYFTLSYQLSIPNYHEKANFFVKFFYFVF